MDCYAQGDQRLIPTRRDLHYQLDNRSRMRLRPEPTATGAGICLASAKFRTLVLGRQGLNSASSPRLLTADPLRMFAPAMTGH